MVFNYAFERIAKMYQRLICFCLTFILLCHSLTATALPTIHADAAILIEPKTKTVLYAKNAHRKFYPASTTKILTSLILLEDMPADTLITKTSQSIQNVPSDSSHIGIQAGEQYLALDGLYAIMLASDNFVSYDMAIKNAGSIDAFSQKMNEKAKQLGALSSHFVNPHGYHDPNHYTTPFDLAQIAKACFNNPQWAQIAGTATYIFFTQGNSKRNIPIQHTAALLDSKNRLYNPYVVGAKTGFHNFAKRTLISKAQYDHIELIGVVMHTDAPLQFEDVNTLFEYGKTNFSVIIDDSGHSTLVNKSYSSWAKPYIDFALEEEWITSSALNYHTPISQRDFLTLLKNSLPLTHQIHLDSLIKHYGDSIYKENLVTTQEEVSHICYELLKSLDKASMYRSTIIPVEDPLLKNPYLNAIKTLINKQVFTINSTLIKSDERITYEQAIAIIYQLKPLLNQITRL